MFEHLHAYWRMEYIQNAEDDKLVSDHLFAEIPMCSDDESVLLLYRGEHSYLVMNKYPYNAGHLLAIPYREVPMLEDLEKVERADLMETILIGQTVLTAAIRPQGFNVGFNLGRSAGAGIPKHMHGHIVPRWSGDNNFMPVIGNTRVLPESMQAMYRKLREHVPASLRTAEDIQNSYPIN